MRFLIAIAFIALISVAYMGENEKKEDEKKDKDHHYMLKFRKCMCIKHIPGACLKLKCCEYYKLIPERVVSEICKYGPCKFFKKKDIKEGTTEKEATVSK